MDWNTFLDLDSIASIGGQRKRDADEVLSDPCIDAVIVKHQEPQLLWILYSAVLALVILTGGYSFFKRSEPAFAENI